MRPFAIVLLLVSFLLVRMRTTRFSRATSFRRTCFTSTPRIDVFAARIAGSQSQNYARRSAVTSSLDRLLQPVRSVSSTWAYSATLSITKTCLALGSKRFPLDSLSSRSWSRRCRSLFSHLIRSLSTLTTQLVAEYVRVVLGLDGVAYRSAQVGEVPFPGQVASPRLGPAERNVVLFGTAALTTADAGEGVDAGLAFVQGSEQMLDVIKIEISYRQNMWAHYQDPPIEDDEEQTQAP